MGKTSKPLTMIALPPVSEWHELEQLESQGHVVVRIDANHAEEFMEACVGADVILGPKCWRMDKDLRKYLALAIKAARVLRYSSKEDRLDEDVAKKELDLGLDNDAVDGSSDAPSGEDSGVPSD